MRKKELTLINSSKLSFNKYLFILFIIYFLINIPWLLNLEGIYWDDWVLYQQEEEDLNIYLSLLGLQMFYYYIIPFIDSEYSMYILKVVTFLVHYFIAVFITYIMASFKKIDKIIIFYIALIYLLIPLTSSVNIVSISSFLFGVFIFYFAFFLLTINIKTNNIYFRILILILFYLSFHTNSVLVYYGIILVYIYVIKYSHIDSSFLNKIKLFFFNYFDFILIPILFFIIKSIYFIPHDEYTGYNSLNFDVLALIKNLIANIMYSIGLLIIKIVNIEYIVILLFFMAFTIAVLKNYIKKISFIVQNPIYILGVGIILIILSLFPYAIVGKIGYLNDWSNRFFILMPLGVSIVTVYSILIFAELIKLQKKIVIYLLLSISFLFGLHSINIKYDFLVDSIYKISIEENFRQSNIIKNNSTFIVKNELLKKFVYGKYIHFYEYTGRLKQIFGTQDKLMVNKKEDINKYKIFKDKKHYNFYNWKESKPIYLEISENININMNLLLVGQLIYYKSIDIDKFNSLVKELIILKIDNFPN